MGLESSTPKENTTRGQNSEQGGCGEARGDAGTATSPALSSGSRDEK